LQLTDFAKVLVLEGLPCCGKSSLARRVASTFETSSCPEIVTKTRHHLSLGRKGAQDNDHLKYQIICQSAKPILVDRYFYSTIAYEAAALSEPLSADIILRINLSLERIALDKHQSRSSLWSNKLFLERFAQSYLIMFDCAVISLITRYCSDVVWVEDVNAFEMASRNLGVVPPYFDRSSGYP
jgi:deoxyadenosine/deoxycytidine kinase